MADNNNIAENHDGGGDIEQGRIIIFPSENNDGPRSSPSSWAAAAVTGSTSTPTTSTGQQRL